MGDMIYREVRGRRKKEKPMSRRYRTIESQGSRGVNPWAARPIPFFLAFRCLAAGGIYFSPPQVRVRALVKFRFCLFASVQKSEPRKSEKGKSDACP